MRNEKLDASVLAPGERPSAGIVIEPHLVLLDAGGPGRGALGIPGVRVAMEGRSLASDGRLLGEFHAADSSHGGAPSGRAILIDECAFNVGTDVAFMVLTGDYNGIDPGLSAAARKDQQAAEHAAAQAQKIALTPDEGSARYEVLGLVEFPPKGSPHESSVPCEPAELRAVVYAKYGDAASAVILYRTWEDAGQRRCSGTVVKYSQGAAAP